MAAAEAVVEEARNGVHHWSEHVQAQTDANAGRISLAQRQAIFDRTREHGPHDLQAYDRALAKWKRQGTGACVAPADAPPKIRATIADCVSREQALRPVMTAAAKAMADWQRHQADMRRSQAQWVPDADRVWAKAWRAAPTNINAFHDAREGFRAPDC